MLFKRWHTGVIKKIQPITETQRYARVLVFGLVIFGGVYAYISGQKLPNPLNKAVADTAILLMGCSMLMSSLCYFWNFVDTKIVYRKHLGLIGFAFALVHLALSFSALQRLFTTATWQQGAMWPGLTGLIAALIFALMAAISNQYAAHQLGGKLWRTILRTGYLAVLLVWFHVVLLRSNHWLAWYQNGMTRPPSMSLIVSGFMLGVLLMRLALWWSLRRARVPSASSSSRR